MAEAEILVRDRGWTAVSEDDIRELLLSSPFVAHYDILETPRNRLAAADLAMPSFLAAVPMFKKLLDGLSGRNGQPNLEEAASDVTQALRQIPDHLELWDWEDTPENRGDLSRLFDLCRSYFAEFGPPKITKLLHLKRPLLIPIIDDQVRRAWNPRARTEWSVAELVDIAFEMGKELGSRRPGLSVLKAVADSLGWPYNSLSRLRLYDIVSWKRRES